MYFYAVRGQALTKDFSLRDRINGLARYGLGGRMDVIALLRAFCDAVERRDGAGFASLFSEDSVYHDAFYGAFVGRAKITELIDDWFYRTAHDFRWDMHEPVTDGHRSTHATPLATSRPFQKRRDGASASKAFRS